MDSILKTQTDETKDLKLVFKRTAHDGQELSL